ncbi:hypothetical protein [Macrococcus armenti]|uniref:Uncharacterized protein n=1 Tax=Macrococcus armenti TaxID=2875764 RepID=A0ABY3ZVW2_9STAP|nr:hypothetical protein [Macrococcus armenti]UBH08074.1 hypothetical protein LAU41_08590 [Macrococcus armenti]UBH10306.1 hypothetical protein LAU38_08515 [Macrococcus armenti]UBH12642.1 hypothetical protein LAU43_08730 [Macrococcus armenti]UBH14784.1 hypothetical protein LAU44_08400 [Macrococcus armenti]UBH17143.1 hypothetical protein LAU39_08430 [Macrococcus armenti]
MRGNKYVYLSIFFVLLSVICNGYNPLMSMLFGSIKAIILFTGIANCIMLIISIVMIDKALKRELSPGLRKLAKVWPFVILIVILLQLLSILILFGII